MTMLDLTEREKMVIELYKKGITPKEIAHQLKMSLRDVYKIIKKEFGENKKELTTELKAIKLYRQKKYPVEVALTLRIAPEEATESYIKYKDLTYLGRFGDWYGRMKGKMREVLMICDAMQRKEVSIDDIVRGFYLADELPEMESTHSAFSRTIDGFREELDSIVSEKEQANNHLQEVYSLLQQAEARLAGVNSQRQNAQAELTRILNTCQNYTAYYNANYPNYYNYFYTPNNNPYRAY